MYIHTHFILLFIIQLIRIHTITFIIQLFCLSIFLYLFYVKLRKIQSSKITKLIFLTITYISFNVYLML